MTIRRREKILVEEIHVEAGRRIREDVYLPCGFSSQASSHYFMSSGDNLYKKKLKREFSHKNLHVTFGSEKKVLFATEGARIW